MAASYPNYRATQFAWVDLYAQPAYAALAGTAVMIQNIANSVLRAYAGGASPPAAHDGFTLDTSQSWSGITDHLWVYGGAPANVAIVQED